MKTSIIITRHVGFCQGYKSMETTDRSVKDASGLAGVLG